MNLHIGGDRTVRASRILVILDLESSASRDTGAFLKAGKAPPPDAKSAVVLSSGGATQVLYSSISAATLQKRCADRLREEI